MTDFEFHSEWRVAADPDAVYQALVDVAAYPSWWPQVTSARWLDDGFGEMRCRAKLPYDLTFRARWVVEDPDNRVLKAELEGDLIGSSQWQIEADGAGTHAVFDQAVDVRKRLMRLAVTVGRPALRFNQESMMRGGERGLRGLLES
ncbi:MAG TPA: SRPBCC family protein [Jatrophihabitantaceae bacterium]|jgi:ribosome-associated toxin RatA of RatAB toxin-antitoxin module|nr:SRPBCC family protein [Jatrophihabitantaceae bacterium]